MRVTAGGLMPPRRVLVGTWVAFGIAVAAGVYLAAVAGWELLVVGVVSIAAGVLYTGGPRPYGYEGLGELFVFVFFGARRGRRLVLRPDRGPALGGRRARRARSGLLAAAILVVNNVRDIETDRRAGKRTLAVRLGRERAVAVFTGDARARLRRGPGHRGARRPRRLGPARRCLAMPLAVPLARTLAAHRDGPALNQLLADTGRLLAVFSVLLAGRAPASS